MQIDTLCLKPLRNLQSKVPFLFLWHLGYTHIFLMLLGCVITPHENLTINQGATDQVNNTNRTFWNPARLDFTRRRPHLICFSKVNSSILQSPIYVILCTKSSNLKAKKKKSNEHCVIRCVDAYGQFMQLYGRAYGHVVHIYTCALMLLFLHTFSAYCWRLFI